MYISTNLRNGCRVSFSMFYVNQFLPHSFVGNSGNYKNMKKMVQLFRKLVDNFIFGQRTGNS